jgi:hypothetical protein
MHVEKVAVRVSASLLFSAAVALGGWALTGQGAWKLVAACVFLLGVLAACMPLLLLVAAKLFWDGRE